MISYLNGTIKQKSEKSITLVVNNVGYKVFTTQNLLDKLKIAQQIEIYTHLRHREDAFDLYGFLSLRELEFFELLITISGVGPKTALGVLEVAKLDDIQKAIVKGEPSLLKKVSGIGAKTAERIVIELKNKLDSLPGSGDFTVDLSDSDSDVFDALVGLGYLERDIREAIRQIPPEVIDLQEKIRIGLKILGNS